MVKNVAKPTTKRNSYELPYVALTSEQAYNLNEQHRAAKTQPTEPQYIYKVTAFRYSSLRKAPTQLTDQFQTEWQARDKALYHILNTPHRQPKDGEGDLITVQITKEEVK
jgi:hypothetical protein